jgi:uncharacterized damage-inducible protein DinB
MAVRRPLDAKRELLEAFDHSGRVSEYLIRVVPPRVWRAEPPGGTGRTIAAIVAHMQSVRRTFIKLGGARPVPPSLDRARSTPAQACRALQRSREALTELFGAALAGDEARVRRMPRRTVEMMLYLVQHDAHHRGQICALVRALGRRLSQEEVMRIWGWKKLLSREAEGVERSLVKPPWQAGYWPSLSPATR